MKAAILKVPQPYDLHGIHGRNLVMQGYVTRNVTATLVSW